MCTYRNIFKSLKYILLLLLTCCFLLQNNNILKLLDTRYVDQIVHCDRKITDNFITDNKFTIFYYGRSGKGWCCQKFELNDKL